METLNVVDEINNAGNWLAEHQVPLIKYAVNRVTSNNMPPSDDARRSAIRGEQ